MTTFVIIIHSIVCLLLVAVILMQSGRGGGLTENFSGAGDVFGAQTNSVMIRLTTILACVFLVTSLGLAFLSTNKDKSLMQQRVATDPTKLPMEEMEKIVIPIGGDDVADQAVPAEVLATEVPVQDAK